MGLLPCQADAEDPLLEVLRGVFDANVQRVPEARIKPLSALAVRDGKLAWMGRVEELVDGDVPEFVSPEHWQTSRMADLAVRESSEVSIELGVTILDGFLAGFGVSKPEIGAKLRAGGAAAVKFSFGDVMRTYVEVAQLGRALTDVRVDTKNPSNAIFFGRKRWRLHVIDSIIASSDFSITVTATGTGGFSLQLPVVQALVADAGLEVTTSGDAEHQITFQGPERLTFAYSCVRLYLDEEGRVTSMPPGAEVRRHADVAPGEVLVETPNRVLLGAEPGLLEWDDPLA